MDNKPKFRKIFCHELRFIDYDLEGSKRKSTFIADRVFNLKIETNMICDGDEVIATFESGKWIPNFKASAFTKRYGLRTEAVKATDVLIKMSFFEDWID